MSGPPASCGARSGLLLVDRCRSGVNRGRRPDRRPQRTRSTRSVTDRRTFVRLLGTLGGLRADWRLFQAIRQGPRRRAIATVFDMEGHGLHSRDARSVGWTDLPIGARLFRIAHAVWGIFNLAALGWIWQSAIRGRRDPMVYASMALLSAEGAALVVGRGDCPFGPFQARLGDPVPMFELVLPPRAAKAAIPMLTVVSLAGFAAVLLRPPRQTGHAI
jgi:hypothetical protein